MISVDQLTVLYDKVQALWDVCIEEIPLGHLIGIIGPNGGGKSTFLKSFMGFTNPVSGKVKIPKGLQVAYVPQKDSVDWSFPITAKELVLMGRYGRMGFFQRLKKADIEAASSALELVQMQSFADRQISELSGGQQQRLFLARALVQGTDVLLLDEPFSGIDVSTEKILISLLKDLRNQGKTIFIVHHDLSSASEYFDWLIMLNTRLIAAGPTKEVFHKDHLLRCFGKHPALFDEVIQLSEKRTSGLV